MDVSSKTRCWFKITTMSRWGSSPSKSARTKPYCSLRITKLWIILFVEYYGSKAGLALNTRVCIHAGYSSTLHLISIGPRSSERPCNVQQVRVPWHLLCLVPTFLNKPCSSPTGRRCQVSRVPFATLSAWCMSISPGVSKGAKAPMLEKHQFSLEHYIGTVSGDAVPRFIFW